MPSDAEQLARLALLAAPRETVKAWDAELTPGDLSAIRWAVRRIGELEGALKPFGAALKGNYSQQSDAASVQCGLHGLDLRWSVPLGAWRRAAGRLLDGRESAKESK